MSYIRPYPFHDITSGSMKPPVMPYAKNNNKPTKLAHNLYGKVLDGMADIHRPVKKEVAHMGGTVLRSFNDTPLQFPLSRNVPHLKRGNYAEIQSILDKSRDEQAKIKSNPDYHLQMKALEAKGYVNMGRNADNEKENALRERLSASGASAEEIEKILKDARIEKFKKDMKTTLSMEQTQQREMAIGAPFSPLKPLQRLLSSTPDNFETPHQLGMETRSFNGDSRRTRGMWGGVRAGSGRPKKMVKFEGTS